MSNVTIFNNDVFGSVRTMIIDDKYYFIGRDVAEALGYSNPAKAVSQHCKHVEKAMIDVSSQNGNAHNKARNSQEMSIIPESDVYRLIIKSKLPAAEQFEEWVMEEVLPQLRMSGVYITETATQESIDYQALYGKNRIYNTFMNTNDIEAEYERFYEMSKAERKARHINNDIRIECSKIIQKALSDRFEASLEEFKKTKQRFGHSKLLAMRELSERIQVDITKLSNKANGGFKAHMTKRIKFLEDEVERLNHLPEFHLVEMCPLSENFMYEPSLSGTPNKDRKRTKVYNYWRSQIHREGVLPLLEDLDVDTEEPLKLYMVFGCPENWDVTNCHKSLIDQISNHYGFDDNLIKQYECLGHSIVETKDEGFIYFALENVKDNKLNNIIN